MHESKFVYIEPSESTHIAISAIDVDEFQILEYFGFWGLWIRDAQPLPVFIVDYFMC